MRSRVLYISYDGLMEPLGQSQVLQYLKELAAAHDVVLVSFEKREDWLDAARREALRAEVDAAGIRWHPLRYHRRPSALATAYDLKIGFAFCSYLVVRHHIQIVHARSYVASVLALALKRVFGTRFIFDMRGFWADERIDGGIWSPSDRIYRISKWFERRFLSAADVIVSLTHAGAEVLPTLNPQAPQCPVEVIPTCTNLTIFRHSGAKRREAGFTLGYVGSVGTWYLFDAVLEGFQVLLELRSDARLLIVNRGGHGYIEERLRAYGIPRDRVELRAVDYTEVSQEMGRVDAGIFYIRPAFSKQASCPTKMGEFLACGVPCISNGGIGDVESVLEGDGVGVVARSLDRAGQREAMTRFLELCAEPEIRARCVEVARRRFSLEAGVAAYDRIYRSLADSTR